MRIGKWFGVAVLVCAPVAARAGGVLDPHKTTLVTYLLPPAAAADGDLSEWRGVPPVTSEKFKVASGPKALEPTASFAPTLRCGRKKGSLDLYFLVVVRDPHTWAEGGGGWLSGDLLEVYLDFGRAKRMAANPTWYKKGGWQGLPEVGQFGFQPRTLRTDPKVFHAMKAQDWKVTYASAPVVGGIAYEFCLRSRSVLDILKMKELPPVIGLDLGLADEDYPVRLQSGDWDNHGGSYRLFGNVMNHTFPTRYGMLSTKPVAIPKDKAPELPRTLQSLYGKSPGAADIRRAMAKRSRLKIADLVYWAGLNGAKFDVALVQAIMRAGSPRAQEACLAVLLYTKGQDPTAIRAAVDGVYATAAKATGQALTMANLTVENLSLLRRADLARLLAHADPTVVFTAARALGAVGEGADAAVLEAAGDAMRDKLTQKIEAGDKSVATLRDASAVFFREAADTLLARTVPIPKAKSVFRRPVLARNTDLPRHLPSDNNNVYNATRLLRSWPKAGPKRLWEAKVGNGLIAVVESGGRAFTAGKIEKKFLAFCFDAAKGEELWRKELPTGAHDSVTPVVDGERVYYVPNGIVCLDALDGNEVWSESKAYRGARYSSPLIVGDVLYLGAAKPAGLVAIDKRTGKVKWKAAEGFESNPGSPAHQVIDGVAQVIVGVNKGNDRRVLGVSPTDGKVFWERPFNGQYGLCASPVVVGAKVLLAAGHGPHYSECLQMYTKAGKIRARFVYRRDKVQSNSHNTPAVVNGRVYGFGKGGLQCSGLADGKLLWTVEWSLDRHLIFADGLLFTTTPKGDLVLCEPTDKGLRELGRAATGLALDGSTQQITLANGRLYVRGKTKVVCYDVVNAR